MTPDKICVLSSGGIDSSLLLRRALDQGKTVYPLYVRWGFRWEEAELHWLKKFLAELAQPTLQTLEVAHCDLSPLLQGHFGVNGKSTPGLHSLDTEVYIPGRNFLLTSLAAIYCEMNQLNEIWLGTLGGNPFADAQPDFFSAQEEVFKLSLGHPLKILRPFSGLKKPELVRQFPNFPLHLTFSCLNPRGLEHCHACNKCEERKKVYAHG